jgi:DNA-directed RNA polymerase omega subunit
MQVHKITASRGTTIDTEKCVENVENKFDLILIAAARAREIKRQHRENPNASFGQVHTNLTALLEIQEGKIGREYLKRIK